MGTHVDTINCPNCGKDDFNLVVSTRPITTSWGNCIECGFEMFPKYSQMDLDLLNGYRTDWNMDYELSKEDEDYKHPLTELPPYNMNEDF